MSQEKDQIFFRNFALAIGILALLMVVFAILSRIYGIDKTAEAERTAPAVTERTAPVGKAMMPGEEEKMQPEPDMAMESAPAVTAADTGGDPGQKTYDNLCVNCHGVSALASMIPQTGDADAWSPRISKGIEVLYDHAINGFTGNMGMMPAKGGNPALSDEDVKAAVDYIVSQSQ